MPHEIFLPRPQVTLGCEVPENARHFGLMRESRRLDTLVDELVKGRAMEKVLRTADAR